MIPHGIKIVIKNHGNILKLNSNKHLYLAIQCEYHEILPTKMPFFDVISWKNVGRSYRYPVIYKVRPQCAKLAQQSLAEPLGGEITIVFIGLF